MKINSLKHFQYNKSLYVLAFIMLFAGISFTGYGIKTLDAQFLKFHLGSSKKEAMKVATNFDMNLTKKSEKNNVKFYVYDGNPVLKGDCNTTLAFWEGNLFWVTAVYEKDKYDSLKSWAENNYGKMTQKGKKKSSLTKDGMVFVLEYRKEKGKVATALSAQHLKMIKKRSEAEANSNKEQFAGENHIINRYDIYFPIFPHEIPKDK